MAIVTGVADTWNLPNYAGELFTADTAATPLLTMSGGLNGGKRTTNFEFPTSLLYEFPDPEQPEISENDSAVAPTPSHIPRDQQSNVVQIHQETIDITYAKQSNYGRLSGLNTAGAFANPINEKDWQLRQKLVKIARDIEHSFINGKYQISTNASVANKTRGLIELTQMSGGTTIDATGAGLSFDMLQELYLEMASNGAFFTNPVMFVNAALKQQITRIYGKVNGFALPATRNVGGLNIQEIEMDFAKMGIVYNRFMPTDAVLITDMAYVEPVFQEVPEKGVLFTEPLAKVGASDKYQLYGQIGLAHGPAFLHGSITGIDITAQAAAGFALTDSAKVDVDIVGSDSENNKKSK